MATAQRKVGDIWSARLYHYQRFCSAWLAITLREQKVFCAKPDRLNDPWDCRPYFRNAFPSINPDGLSIEVQIEVAKRGIYCLTPDPLSTLMWSHYGDNHAGVCLEFHCSNSLFTTAQGVVYEDEYPTILPDQLFTKKTVKTILLTKAKCWHYEDEFRLLGSPFWRDDHPLKLHEGYLKLPDRSLLSVIVGCNGDHKAVTEIVREHSPATRVIRLLRAPNEYKLMMAIDRQS